MRLFVNALIALLILFSCANPVVPPGGPKDVEPPQVIVAQPASGAIYYQGNRIELLFNEYINFQGGVEKTLITPAMKPKPKFVLKGKKLIIQLPDSLDSEITYSISLLNAVTDFTEGNPLKWYKYVFTRGSSIDSASLSGIVENSFDRKPVGGVFVGLFQVEDTSVFINTQPIYVATTNEQGQFKIDYVKEGKYKVAALEDKNFDFKLDPQTERVSLSTNSLTVQKGSVLEQNLPVFLSKQDPQIGGYKVLSNSSLYVYFNQEIEDVSIDIEQYADKDKVYFNEGNDTLFYHWSTRGLEQLDMQFVLNQNFTDSLSIPLLNKTSPSGLAVKREAIHNKHILITTEGYIEKLNQKYIHVQDSLNNDLAFTTSMDKELVRLKLDKKYIGEILLSIDSGAIEYITGVTQDKDFIKRINLSEAIAHSVLSLKFANKAIEGSILELYGANEKRLRVLDISGQAKLSIKDIKAGNYTIRVYMDRNANGKWDSGNVFDEIEPEPTLLFNEKVEIKENWDKELLLNF